MHDRKEKESYETKWLIGWDVQMLLTFHNAMCKLDGEVGGKIDGVLF